MKRFFKYASSLVLTGLLSVSMFTASAQRGATGGGGGVRVSGGGGFGGGSIGIRGGTGFGAQNRGNFSPRTGANYRGVTGSGYFAGSGYHGGAFYRPGFGYYGYPHIGFYLNALPFGYYPFFWDSAWYYYYGGIFYSPYSGGGYQVTAPPVGARIPSLPKNANAIRIDGVQYYEADGVYYKESADDKGKKIYVVAGRDGVLNTDDSVTDPNAAIAAPRVGDIVNQLPDGCRKVKLNGKKYFVSPNGIYYEKVTDPNGNTGYRIASLPDDEKGA
ncbi:MAG: hypothetical protein JWP94_2581 [Mucilaginibacter sp.]|nr:hypothetical protein [Mucilaginibacter sp.]